MLPQLGLCGQDLDEYIKHLEEEISKTIERQKVLTQEISIIVPSLPAPNGISRLPEEIFTSILYQVLLENPRWFRRLFLVSRTWYNFILATPQLWSNICVTVPVNPAAVDQCTAHCFKHIGRSAQCLLDIRIDYTPVDWLTRRVRQAVATIAEEVKPGWDHYALKEFVLNENPAYLYFRSLYLKPFLALCGQDFSEMARWRSFEMEAGIFWNYTPLFRAAFSSSTLQGKTPHLEHLILRYSGEGKLWNNLTARWIAKLPSKCTIFPHIPAIRQLILDHVEVPIDLTYVEPRRINELSIMAYNTEQFSFALRCCNVTRLRIGIPGDVAAQELNGSGRLIWPKSLPECPISFPKLRYLQVGQRIPIRFWQELEAPVLETISIEDADAFANLYCIPYLSSLTRLELRYPYLHNTGESQMSRNFRAFAQSLPSLKTILCSEWGKKWWLDKCLRDLLREGIVLKSLTTLLIIKPPYNQYDTDPAHYEAFTPEYS